MPLNNITKNLNKVNRTIATASRTQNTVSNMKNRINKAQQSRAQTRAKELTWKCGCGQTNQSAFCGGCGKAPTTCPNCNIMVDTQFCPDCGTPVTTE